MTDVVLVDNTVLSNFGVVGRLDLLVRLAPPAAQTTESVLAEYAAGIGRGTLPAGHWPSLPVTALAEEDWPVAASLPARLGPGERTCLTLAIRRQGAIATDDLRARGVAQSRGLDVTGTVGVLAQCVRRSLISRDEANTLLSQMIAAGYHSPAPAIDPLLNL